MIKVELTTEEQTLVRLISENKIASFRKFKDGHISGLNIDDQVRWQAKPHADKEAEDVFRQLCDIYEHIRGDSDFLFEQERIFIQEFRDYAALPIDVGKYYKYQEGLVNKLNLALCMIDNEN